MGVTGILLSGGKSSRMKKEKGKCLLKGKPLIEYSVELLRDICDSVIISANSNDYNYLGCRVVYDEMESKGPASGIYSGLKASETNGNLILSCDMPMITSELIRYILTFDKNVDAVVPVFNGFPEPLCAFYSKSCLPVFGNSLKTSNFKLQNIIRELNCLFIEIEPSLNFYTETLFTNVNTPEDLMKLELQLTNNTFGDAKS